VDALTSQFRQQEVEVYVAVALNRAESHVSAGENDGRTLLHVAVARNLVTIGRLRHDEGFAQDIRLTLEAGLDASKLRVIAFVQEPKQGRIFGAAEQSVVSVPPRM